MNERNSELVKATLAATIEKVKLGDEFEDGLPLHMTVAPPFYVKESSMYDLVLAYYNEISPWASLVYDDGEVTEMHATKDTAIFGTNDHPVLVRRISLKNEVETSDFLSLREMIKDATEEVCGQKSINNWVLGELHVSEGEHDLSILDGRIAVDSLVLFVKRNSKWRVEEKFAWVD